MYRNRKVARLRLTLILAQVRSRLLLQKHQTSRTGRVSIIYRWKKSEVTIVAILESDVRRTRIRSAPRTGEGSRPGFSKIEPYKHVITGRRKPVEAKKRIRPWRVRWCNAASLHVNPLHRPRNTFRTMEKRKNATFPFYKIPCKQTVKLAMTKNKSKVDNLCTFYRLLDSLP